MLSSSVDVKFSLLAFALSSYASAVCKRPWKDSTYDLSCSLAAIDSDRAYFNCLFY